MRGMHCEWRIVTSSSSCSMPSRVGTSTMTTSSLILCVRSKQHNWKLMISLSFSLSDNVEWIALVLTFSLEMNKELNCCTVSSRKCLSKDRSASESRKQHLSHSDPNHCPNRRCSNSTRRHRPHALSSCMNCDWTSTTGHNLSTNWTLSQRECFHRNNQIIHSQNSTRTTPTRPTFPPQSFPYWQLLDCFHHAQFGRRKSYLAYHVLDEAANGATIDNLLFAVRVSVSDVDPSRFVGAIELNLDRSYQWVWILDEHDASAVSSQSPTNLHRRDCSCSRRRWRCYLDPQADYDCSSEPHCVSLRDARM